MQDYKSAYLLQYLWGDCKWQANNFANNSWKAISTQFIANS